jgi:hypothetical protein
MAQLTSNTDNKVKKLVMFFAGASLLSIKLSIRGFNRDRASVLYTLNHEKRISNTLSALYRDTRNAQ